VKRSTDASTYPENQWSVFTLAQFLPSEFGQLSAEGQQIT
jgi:hypothetical protein